MLWRGTPAQRSCQFKIVAKSRVDLVAQSVHCMLDKKIDQVSLNVAWHCHAGGSSLRHKQWDKQASSCQCSSCYLRRLHGGWVQWRLHACVCTPYSVYPKEVQLGSSANAELADWWSFYLINYLLPLQQIMRTCTSCQPNQCTMYDSSVDGAIQPMIWLGKKSVFGWCCWINFMIFADLLISTVRLKSSGRTLAAATF